MLFNVEMKPASQEEISAELAKILLQQRLLKWLIIPAGILLFFCGRFLITVINGPSDPAMNSAVSFLLTMLSLIAIGLYSASLAGGKLGLTVISLDYCEEALALSNKYPEIDAYRKAVVKERELVKDDLNAMRTFAQNRERANTLKALKAKQQEAFDALHAK